MSLVDIVQFIQENWKLLLGSGIAGAVLGLGGWFTFANYKAELFLQNNGRFDIISWRSTEKILPILAAEMLEKKAVPDNQVPLYRKISSPAWWSKNVQVNYALTKSETKNLAAVSKDLDVAATTIISFEVSAAASSEEQALNEVRSITEFIGNTASYIAIKNLINDYEIKSISQFAEIQQKISATEIETGYLQERASNLAQLHKSYPSATGVTQQIQQLVDTKDVTSKFLPLTTQIIGVKNDIAFNYESLKRLNDQLNQIKTYKVFLESATPLIVGRYDGIAMIRDLLAVEESMRAKTPPGDIKTLQYLNNIRAQLVDIEVRYHTRQLAKFNPIVGKSINMFTSVAIGFLIACLSMLILLLGLRILSAINTLSKKH